MRSWRAWAAALVVVATMGANQGIAPAAAEEATAGDAAGILILAPTPAKEDLIQRASALRERFVALDLALLERALVAGSADRDAKVRFELFPDAVVELATDSFSRRADGFAWSGTGTGADGSDQEATVVFHQPSPEALAEGAIPAVVGNFWADKSQYRLQAATRTGAVYSVVELDQAAVAESEGGPDDHGHDDGTAEESSDTGDQPDGVPSVPLPFGAGTAQATAEAAADGGMSVIDVLVVHTEAALRARPDVQAELAAQLEAGNRANDTSGVRFHFRVAHFQQVQWTEDRGDMAADLRKLREGTIPGVHQARDTYAADLVIMAGAGYTDYCGLATIVGANASTAFAVVDADPNCVLTAVHEMGHLLGLRHDWQVDGTPGYNHGFVNTVARFRTIMAYNHPDCGPAGCMRIEHWSDPDRTWNGQQTGVPDGQPNPADNGRALAESFGPAVNFRVPPSQPVGSYDTLTQEMGGTRVRGWAIDFDTPAQPVTVHVYVDGGVHGGYVASKPRHDVSNVYPNAGTAHGFDEVLFIDDGLHEVCVYALDTQGSGSNTYLGCKSIHVRTRPFGSFDGITRVPGGARVFGWAMDPDTGEAPTTVTARVTGDAAPTTDTADRHRPDLDHHGQGPNHGFSTLVETTSGAREFCVDADNVGPGTTQSLGCRWETLAADPFGDLNAVARAPGGARVTGWAIDPDTASPIPVRFTVDGVPAAAELANRNRPDVGNGNPWYGADHGYSTIVPMTSGTIHEVCVVGTNVDSGADRTLGCVSFRPDPHPYGYFDALTRPDPALLVVEGWAIDPDVGGPIPVRVTVDGVVTQPAPAAGDRPDVGRDNPEYGPNHGYKLSIPVTPGPHHVCVTAVNVGAGKDVEFGCADSGHNPVPFGTLDEARIEDPSHVYLRGWAVDGDTPTAPIPVRVTVDGVEAAVTLAAEERADVAGAYPDYGPNHGYTVRIPVAPGGHTVCVTAVNTGAGTDTLLGCRNLAYTASPYGTVDEAVRQDALHVYLRGWAIDWDTTAPIAVRATVDGVEATVTLAAEERADVGGSYPEYGPNHGYTLRVPVGPGRHTVCVTAVNTGGGADTTLGCPTL
ncbi:MAG: M12 family metallo-peptidase [Actinomycetota bacterium]|nr:M12 family metallo-peptidase [Actinomycetota bacterium]